MIHADIHGKSGVPEDRLTSNVLGLLRLLPDDCYTNRLSAIYHRNYLSETQVNEIPSLYTRREG